MCHSHNNTLGGCEVHSRPIANVLNNQAGPWKLFINLWRNTVKVYENIDIVKFESKSSRPTANSHLSYSPQIESCTINADGSSNMEGIFGFFFRSPFWGVVRHNPILWLEVEKEFCCQLFRSFFYVNIFLHFCTCILFTSPWIVSQNAPQMN